MPFFTRIIVAVLATTICGCDSYPSPTRKNVTASDVVGTWHYTCRHPGASADIIFNADGTFHQTVNAANSATPMVRDGRWTLTNNRVEMKEPLVYLGGGWGPFLLSWGFIDSSTRRGEVAIQGGIIPDPDSYVEFSKVK